MRPGNIDVHIEELVLYGFAPGDRHRIGDAVQRELVRLFAGGSLEPSTLRGAEYIDAGTVNAGRGAKVETIGARVAQVIYGGLRR